MMKNNIKTKYKVTLILIAVLLIVVSYLGVSYAFLPPKQEETPASSVVTIDNLSITYFDDEEITIPKFAPKDEYFLRFSITNSSTEDVYYSLEFDDVINMVNGEVSLNISSTNNGGNVSNGYYPKDASEIINQVKISGETTQTYTLKLVNISDSIGEIGGKLKITILKNIIEENEEPIKNFASTLLENNPVKEAATIPGKENGINNEGLIKNEDDLGTTYYFRGKINNNYVSFAGYTWRIVRINGDNTVRLILDNILDETTIYNNVNESNYLESYKFMESPISLFLNSWYEKNLKSSEDKLVANSFCNDYEVVNTDGYVEEYTGYKNVLDGNPTFKCQNRISLKIGLINVNEILFAGNSKSDTNINNYLYNPKITNGWWTMSASYKNNNTNELYMYSLNAFTNELKDTTLITSEKGIRPVINLSKNVTVTGTGTLEDPYVIV